MNVRVQRPRAIRQSAAIALCLLMSACGSSEGFRDTIGLNRKGPDEFQVFARPPLTVPPEFNLRPPAAGTEEYSANVSATDAARSRVLAGDNAPLAASAPLAATAVPMVSSGDLPSNSDSQFLANAGTQKANRNIKQQIAQDRQEGVIPQDKDKTYLFGGDKDKKTVVDAEKETQRLKDNKAKNLPPTAGETPVKTPESKGILGDLF